jgi:LmbE family N-acetylglucosaminyl deacetylase
LITESSVQSIMKQKFKKIFIKFLYYLITKLCNHHQISSANILILSPHPDDEIIGLGGLLLQTLQIGGKIQIVYLTDGEGSGACSDNELIKQARIGLSETMAEKLNIPKQYLLRLHLPDGAVPQNGLPEFGDAAKKIADLIDLVQPDAVFATSQSDYWPFDHVACSELAIAAVKQSTYKPELWFYWVWAWYNLRPWQLFKLKLNTLCKIDIAGQLKQKKELMDLYLNPLSPEGKPWSGVLPKAMLYPFSKPFELIEKYEQG